MTGPQERAPGDVPGSGPATPEATITRRHRRRGHRHRPWGRIAAVVILLVLVVGVVTVGVAAATYLPLVGDAQRTRDELQALADRVKTVGTNVDAATIAGLRADLAAASADVDRLAKVVHDDPIVAAARILPPLRDQVDGARAVLDNYRPHIPIHPDWPVVRLADVCETITDGDHQPPPKASEGVPFVTITNINDEHELDFTKTFFVPESYDSNLNANRKPQGGDILYTVTGSYGIPVLVPEQLERCRSADELYPVYSVVNP